MCAKLRVGRVWDYANANCPNPVPYIAPMCAKGLSAQHAHNQPYLHGKCMPPGPRQRATTTRQQSIQGMQYDISHNIIHHLVPNFVSTKHGGDPHAKTACTVCAAAV